MKTSTTVRLNRLDVETGNDTDINPLTNTVAI